MSGFLEQRVVQLDAVRARKAGEIPVLGFGEAAGGQPVGYGPIHQEAAIRTGACNSNGFTTAQSGDGGFEGVAPRGDYRGVHAPYYSPMVNIVKRIFGESLSATVRAIIQRITAMLVAMSSAAKPHTPINLMSFDAIAARMEAVRIALDIDKAELCRRCGIQPSTYSNYLNETKRNRPDPETAAAIARGLDITMDWIYRGSLAGLNDRMRAALSQHPYAAP